METDSKPIQRLQQTKEKMSKEEKAERRRNDRIAREKDRERKRAKRQNPAYRQMEQERDRERKKMLRSDTTFRTLEKIRDRMRKERKRFVGEIENSERRNFTVAENLLEPEVVLSSDDVAAVEESLLEPEVILSSGDVTIGGNLLEPEVILSTNEFSQPQQQPQPPPCSYLPQPYNSNLVNRNPTNNSF